MIKISNIASLFAEIYNRYKKLGFDIYGGYSPFLKVQRPSNYVVKQKQLMCTSGGIANDEMFIIYPTLLTLKPKNILVIGNAYGISTLFVSLSLKTSKVVALDKYRTKGIAITKKLLKGIKNKYVIKGSTPEDLEKIIKKYFNNKLDMVFVDAVHTNEYQTKEFLIYEKYLSKNSIVFFHDVISCNLLKSFIFLKNKYKNYSFQLLNKSSNGLAICMKKKSYKLLENYFNYFSTQEPKTSEFIEFINDTNKKNKNIKFFTPQHPQL